MRNKAKEINSLKSQGFTLHTDRKFSKHQLPDRSDVSLSQNSKKSSHNKPVHANEISTVVDSFNTSIGQFVILRSGRISFYIKGISRDVTVIMSSLRDEESAIAEYKGLPITPIHIGGKLRINPSKVVERYNHAIARCQESYFLYLASIGKQVNPERELLRSLMRLG